MTEILVEKQEQSIYDGHVEVDEAYTKKLLSASIGRHGGKHDGGTLVNVIEGKDGTVEAFLLATLTRVYGIGKLLVADTGFLVATDKAPLKATEKLLEAYIEWAEGNPKVYEINATFTDVLPTGPKMDAVYRRFGFVNCGSIYRYIRSSEGEAQAA